MKESLNYFLNRNNFNIRYCITDIKYHIHSLLLKLTHLLSIFNLLNKILFA